LATTFLWIMSVVYVPGITIVILTFFFTGLFAAALLREGVLKTRTFSLVHHPKLSFISVLVLVALLIANVALGYSIIERALSLTYFKSLQMLSATQNLNQAEAHMMRAVQLGRYDLYYRG